MVNYLNSWTIFQIKNYSVAIHWFIPKWWQLLGKKLTRTQRKKKAVTKTLTATYKNMQGEFERKESKGRPGDMLYIIFQQCILQVIQVFLLFNKMNTFIAQFSSTWNTSLFDYPRFTQVLTEPMRLTSVDSLFMYKIHIQQWRS